MEEALKKEQANRILANMEKAEKENKKQQETEVDEDLQEIEQCIEKNNVLPSMMTTNCPVSEVVLDQCEETELGDEVVL